MNKHQELDKEMDKLGEIYSIKPQFLKDFSYLVLNYMVRRTTIIYLVIMFVGIGTILLMNLAAIAILSE